MSHHNFHWNNRNTMILEKNRKFCLGYDVLMYYASKKCIGRQPVDFFVRSPTKIMLDVAVPRWAIGGGWLQWPAFDGPSCVRHSSCRRHVVLQRLQQTCFYPKVRFTNQINPIKPRDACLFVCFFKLQILVRMTCMCVHAPTLKHNKVRHHNSGLVN